MKPMVANPIMPSATAQGSGFRGYIGSRLYGGQRTAQHIQNLAIRDYAARHGLRYLLSATEYSMRNCYMMLEDVLNQIQACEGIILFSMHMLPRSPDYRRQVYERVLECGRELHTAQEEIAVRSFFDADRLEETLLIQQAIEANSPPRFEDEGISSQTQISPKRSKD